MVGMGWQCWVADDGRAKQKKCNRGQKMKLCKRRVVVVLVSPVGDVHVLSPVGTLLHLRLSHLHVQSGLMRCC